MGRIGLPELLIILGIVVLFVGAKRLPDLARSLGRSVKEFQRALKGDRRHDDHQPHEP